MKLLFLFILLTTHLEAVFEFTICSFFQDEADYLKEWIEYHRIIGFEHFILYNNNSKDHFRDVLEPYIQDGIVELFDRPSPPGEFWASHQINAFNQAIRYSIGKTTWLALIDIDEFIVPVHGKEDFKTIMRELEQNDTLGGLALFWQVFGSSDLWDIPSNSTLIESLTRHAGVSYPLNQFVKSIVRPERVDFYEIHSGSYKKPFLPYTLNGPIPQQKMDQEHGIIHAPLRINHYWIRTLKWFYERKIPRLRQFNSNSFDQEEAQNLNDSLNIEWDDAILQYVPELKSRLGVL